ncbi:MAG: PQQ-binding-like beta-propeller repeat protein [SAR324 cluster bacterium]|uniref:PQQ-binding-like beta-propeller repeat protein n=1 Tax=SAR324 cluster bacterium TaxID=2024889 RepID=A0A7X9IIE9_9DELT|nr:PQQ-binding-like beta-propeller repeat protein [SAR324 cluster bacterium]
MFKLRHSDLNHVQFSIFMRSLIFALLINLNLLFLSVDKSLGQSYYGPPPLPGWAHANNFDSSQEAGLSLGGKRVIYSSPVVADVDGNVGNGLEVVVIGSDRKVHARKADGSTLWDFQISDSSCSTQPPIMSSPAVTELYGNGVPYVVVTYGGLTSEKCDGGVIVIKGIDGKQAWRFSTKAFDKKASEWAMLYGVISTPALADVDGDGNIEIAFGSFDRHVYLLNSNGSLRWYYIAADTVFSSPAFADLNGDGKLELIIGTDISQNLKLNPPTYDGGYVYALSTKSRKLKRVNFRDSKSMLWGKWFDQVIQGSPVVADVLASHKGNEIIVTSGCFFPKNEAKTRGRWIKILAAESGKCLKTLTAPTCFSSSPAVGDIDSDGQLEIVASVNGTTTLGGDGKGRLIAWKAETSEPMWSVIPRTAGTNESYMGTYIGPTIADLDGNGSMEVIVATGRGISVHNGFDGRALTCQSSSCEDNPFVISTSSSLKNSPAIGDLNNDGVLDLVAAGSYLFGWTNFSGLLQSDPAGLPPYSAAWPMLRGNALRNGTYH